MRRLSLYLETSVWSHYFHEDVPERQAATRAFLDGSAARDCELLVSPIVLLELSRAPEPLRGLLLALVRRLGPTLLPHVPEVDVLADAYLREKILPASKREDALHVAFATVCEVDALISWNQRHLANLRRRLRVAAVNLRHGFVKPLDMLTVWEVQDGEDTD